MTQRSAYQTHAAGGMKALGGVYGYVLTSGLPKPLMDLVYLRASQINGCSYCMDLHSHDALAEGASVQKLMLVSAWREAAAYFSDRERVALAWTESVTRVADTHVPDEDYAAAAAQFTEKELADLTLGIGLINAYNRMAIAFRRPPDPLRRLVTPDPATERTATTLSP
jgi:AhpD family alkylhydroperoxidase